MWHYNFGPYLQHYASEYYDPVKAHEYYEKHKKLKGRTKKATLTDEGKEIASTVKANINEERDQALSEEDERHRREQEIRNDATKRTMEQHRMIMNQRITSIQNIIKRMPENRKHDEAPKLKAAIQKLREDNDKKRASIQAKSKTENASASEQHAQIKSQIRDWANQTYDSEYQKLESRYAKKSKK